MADLPPDFLRFWQAYPRHEARKDALKAWGQIQPDADTVTQMIATLAWQSVSEAWRKEDGLYIPLPASWLRGERWTDELPKAQQVKQAERVGLRAYHTAVEQVWAERKRG